MRSSGSSRHWADREENPWDRLAVTQQPGVTLLAYLVLADGKFAHSATLAHRMFPSSRDPMSTLRGTVRRLRLAGILIETGPIRPDPRAPRGYRLLTLPDDDQLAPILREIDQIKSTTWWRRMQPASVWPAAV